MLLQYVDDLLVAGKTEDDVWKTTVKLFILGGEKGLKVSRKYNTVFWVGREY